MKKIRVGVIFGGKSGEHEVSLVSASSIINAIDKRKYEVVEIGITKDGRWVVEGKPLADLKGGTPKNPTSFPPEVLLSLDVAFPVLHGPFGEDGTIQGLFEMLDLPYVGAGVLASAIAMDKATAKRLFRDAGLPVVPHIVLSRSRWEEEPDRALDEIEGALGYPCFVKPSALGSSVGITKVKTRGDLAPAIKLAFEFDFKVLIEKGIPAREIECSVLGNEELIVSPPGEVIPEREFYDYYDKYVGGKTKFEIPAKLPKEKIEEVRKIARTAYKLIDCAGLARVDFLLDKENGKLYLSELNTMPGFTEISMYPKLLALSGIPYPELIDRLITLGIERYNMRKRLRYTITPPEDWYRKR